MPDLITNVLTRQRDAEKMLAVASFVNPEGALEYAGWLSPDVLADGEVRQYWRTLLAEKDTTKAALSVSTDFYIWLSGGISDYPGLNTYTDIPHLADQVAHEHWFAAVASRLSTLAKTVADNDYDRARMVIGEMESSSPKSGESLPDIADTGIEFLASLEADNRIVRSRIGKLDTAIAGWWRSCLTVLCARPRIGKTTLALQVARNATVDNHKVLFSSLEMSRKTLWARAVCGTARIPYRDVLAKRITEAQINDLININNSLIESYDGKLLIDDRPLSTSDLWRLVAREKPDLLIVDHIRLLSDRADNETHRLGSITWNLKKLAKEFDIAVIALAQLNRQLEQRADKQPTLADLRDSGEIEENADMVLGLHRDMVYVESHKERSPAMIEVLKFRDGPSPIKIGLSFDGLGQWFAEE